MNSRKSSRSVTIGRLGTGLSLAVLSSTPLCWTRDMERSRPFHLLGVPREKQPPSSTGPLPGCARSLLSAWRWGGGRSTSAEGCRSVPALTSAARSSPAVFGPDQPRVGDNESGFLLPDLGASLASDASPPSTLNHLLWWDSDRGTFHDFYLSFVQFISAYHTPETPVTSFSPLVYGRLG